MIRTLDDLLALYRQRAGQMYGLAAVTQLQHGLQSARLAAAAGLGDAMVAAALFHDVGHLVVGREQDLAARGIDDRHERSGGRILDRLFGPTVSAPVSLHVSAKRYLCAIEPGYFALLSADSVRSLALQGGPMSHDEALAFNRLEHGQQAVALRRIDEQAKDPDAVAPALEHYLPLIEGLLRPAA